MLGGWSRGARAGAALTLHPEIVDGWRPSAFVGIAGGYDVRPDGKNPAAPTTGTVPLDDAAAADGLEPVPIWLVHGTADASVPIADSRKLAATLTGHGWPVRLHEIEGADHSAVVWADVVDETGRSRAGATEAARRAGTTTAALVGEALSASA